jgi:hypothetical protein
LSIPLKKIKAIYALGTLMFFGAALMFFIIAADEQSVISSGSPAPNKIRLQELTTQGPGTNRHIELAAFYFGRQYIYTAKLAQFRDVYLPLFPQGQPEKGSNLRILLWIRNDRASNQRLIEGERDLDKFVAEFNDDPRTVAGILRKPTNRVRALTADTYPGTNLDSLQALWARNFPQQDSVNITWAACAILLLAAAVCAIAYRRTSPQRHDHGVPSR